MRRRVVTARVAVGLGAVLLAACGTGTPDWLDDGGPAEGARGTPPGAVVLTPSADPSTSQTFTWRSSTDAAGQQVTLEPADGGDRVVARAERKEATTVAESGSDLPAYTSTATDLRPGTSYTYRIENADGATGEQDFTTADDEIGQWSFLALGDTQVDNADAPARIVRTAVSEHPEASLVLQAGDLIDHPYRHDQWLEALNALAPVRTTRNVISSIGNHEQCIMGGRCRHGDAQAFRAYFTFPDNGFEDQRPTWFRTDVQGVRFIVLDSFGDDLETQAAFLEESLATSEQRWTVVLMHSGPFASRTKRSNTTVHAALRPIMEKHDVDLVLSGHDHVYSRGFQGDPDGTVFAASNSGPKVYELDDADWKRRDATRVVGAEQVSTYQVVDVNEDELRYRAVAAHLGRNPDPAVREGDVIDEVTITKDASGRKDVDW